MAVFMLFDSAIWEFIEYDYLDYKKYECTKSNLENSVKTLVDFKFSEWVSWPIKTFQKNYKKIEIFLSPAAAMSCFLFHCITQVIYTAISSTV